jgi:hypothetical protein
MPNQSPQGQVNGTRADTGADIEHRPRLAVIRFAAVLCHCPALTRSILWLLPGPTWQVLGQDAKFQVRSPFKGKAIGYPIGRFGPVRRIALADVVYEERWGQTCRDL